MKDFHVEDSGGHAKRGRGRLPNEGRGRPSAEQTQLRLSHEIEDLKKENADLRARMADHFFALSVPLGGA